MSETPIWETVDFATLETGYFAQLAQRMSPQQMRSLYQCEFPPPTFEEAARQKMQARPAKFSWGEPIPGLWRVPGYPELTTPQLEQVMKEQGHW